MLWHCWLGHTTRKIVSEVTYNVSSGTLNPTIPYHLRVCLSVTLVYLVETGKYIAKIVTGTIIDDDLKFRSEVVSTYSVIII